MLRPPGLPRGGQEEGGRPKPPALGLICQPLGSPSTVGWGPRGEPTRVLPTAPSQHPGAHVCLPATRAEPGQKTSPRVCQVSCHTGSALILGAHGQRQGPASLQTLP